MTAEPVSFKPRPRRFRLKGTIIGPDGQTTALSRSTTWLMATSKPLLPNRYRAKTSAATSEVPGGLPVVNAAIDIQLATLIRLAGLAAIGLSLPGSVSANRG
jgi:hypothetical protein